MNNKKYIIRNIDDNTIIKWKREKNEYEIYMKDIKCIVNKGLEDIRLYKNNIIIDEDDYEILKEYNNIILKNIYKISITNKVNKRNKMIRDLIKTIDNIMEEII